MIAIMGLGEQAPYTGAIGQTTVVRVHVPTDQGMETVHLYRSINTQTHPELAVAAVSGELHRVDTGQELAAVFVVHDPVMRRFALVIPDVLRHHTLREQAKLIEDLATDVEHPVPRYVEEFDVVFGPEQLAAYLDVADNDAELDQDVVLIRSRSDAPPDGEDDHGTHASIDSDPLSDEDSHDVAEYVDDAEVEEISVAE